MVGWVWRRFLASWLRARGQVRQGPVAVVVVPKDICNASGGFYPDIPVTHNDGLHTMLYPFIMGQNRNKNIQVHSLVLHISSLQGVNLRSLCEESKYTGWTPSHVKMYRILGSAAHDGQPWELRACYGPC